MTPELRRLLRLAAAAVVALPVSVHAGQQDTRARAHRTLDGPLTGPSSKPAAVIAREFIDGNPSLLGLTAEDAATLTLTRNHASRSDSLRHLYFRQSVDGIDVFDAMVGVHVDAVGRIQWITTSAMRIANRDVIPAINDDVAVRVAVGEIEPNARFDSRRVTQGRGRERRSRWTRGPFKRDIEARLVYVPTGDRLELGWLVSTLDADGQAHEVVVSASAGTLVAHR
jgi:extracellular elastinolytic metalloproteinase